MSTGKAQKRKSKLSKKCMKRDSTSIVIRKMKDKAKHNLTLIRQANI